MTNKDRCYRMMWVEKSCFYGPEDPDEESWILGYLDRPDTRRMIIWYREGTNS